MTSPFTSWKTTPSKIAEEMQRDANRAELGRRNTKSQPLEYSKVLAPKRFHVFSKAGVK